MRQKIEHPTVKRVETEFSKEIWTHPAYAQISVSRVSGETHLYGSDFNHQHYVSISIKSSCLHRTLSRDWPLATSQEYISIDMSEAQWAEFVSSFNVGSGVQCTLVSFKGEKISSLPPPESKEEKFKNEARETLTDALKALTGLSESIKTTKLSQKQQIDLLEQVDTVRRELLDTLPYVLDSFNEYMETTVQKAKVEINSHATHAIVKAGVEALGIEPVIKLGD